MDVPHPDVRFQLTETECTVQGRVQPTGAQRVVRPEELFFSTTDRRGVIDSANSVFVRIAQYSEEALLGAPHNIVRHPDMPAGLFQIMWDRLLAGQSVATYVKNLAADGAQYWTLATMTPLGDGFLSVRSAVTRKDHWEKFNGLYAVSLEAERAAREAGASASAAARIGADALEDAVRAAGYEDFSDAMRQVLPAEVEARAAASQPLQGSYASGTMGALLQANAVIEEELGDLLGRLDAYLVLASRMRDAHAAVGPAISGLAAASAAAASAGEDTADEAPTLTRSAGATALSAADARGRLESLVGALKAVRSDVLDLRVVIALSSLHNSMAAEFARAVAMGNEGEDSLLRVAKLCDALARSISDMEAMLDDVNGKLARIAAGVNGASDALRDFQRQLSQWRNLAARFGVGTGLNQRLAPIDAQLRHGLDQVRDFTALGDQAVALAGPFSSLRLRAAVDQMRSAVATVTE